ncbi:MAG: hypothetical protein PHG20_06935, partial [Geobacteraceae bacterium]|nr:hypothetical protein [Geobacteraceae bacterium]
VPVQDFLAASQQEFLVQDELSLADLPIDLICRNDQDHATLSYLMRLHGIHDFSQGVGEATRNSIIIDPSYYFRDNPTLEACVDRGRVAAQIININHTLKGHFQLKAKPIGSDVRLQRNGDSTVIEIGGNSPLDISFDRRLGLSGTLDADITIRYEEAGQEWLVYSGILKADYL